MIASPSLIPFYFLPLSSPPTFSLSIPSTPLSSASSSFLPLLSCSALLCLPSSSPLVSPSSPLACAQRRFSPGFSQSSSPSIELIGLPLLLAYCSKWSCARLRVALWQQILRYIRDIKKADVEEDEEGDGVGNLSGLKNLITAAMDGRWSKAHSLILNLYSN